MTPRLCYCVLKASVSMQRRPAGALGKAASRAPRISSAEPPNVVQTGVKLRGCYPNPHFGTIHTTYFIPVPIRTQESFLGHLLRPPGAGQDSDQAEHLAELGPVELVEVERTAHNDLLIRRFCRLVMMLLHQDHTLRTNEWLVGFIRPSVLASNLHHMRGNFDAKTGLGRADWGSCASNG